MYGLGVGRILNKKNLSHNMESNVLNKLLNAFYIFQKKYYMSRRGAAQKRLTRPDPVYRNRLLNMLANRILKNGKKNLSYHILYKAMKSIKLRTTKNPLSILRQAVRRATPNVAVKAKRRGGSTYQVPVEVKPDQGKALAIRWILSAAKKRAGVSMASKFSYELMDAARQTGNAIRKREETHRMAEANRAFALFR